MKLNLLLLLGASAFLSAQNLTPELLYYNFETATGANVPNLATNPPVNATTATIMGAPTVGNNIVCPGKALVGSGGSSTSNYLASNWNMSLSGSWSVHLKLGNFVNGTDSTLYYFFGDATTEFRCFTNGVAGTNNVILRSNAFPDITINNVFDANAADQKDVVFTYSGSTGQLKGYLNGVLVTTVSGNVGLTLSGGAFKVGGYSSNTGLKAGMTMDEFGLFSRELTAAEVVSLAANCSLLAVDDVKPVKEPVKYVINGDYLQSTTDKIGAYQIFDMSGKMIISNTTKTNQIDISSLVKGVYVIKANGISQRFVY